MGSPFSCLPRLCSSDHPRPGCDSGHTEKSDGSPLSVEDKKAIFEAYDVPNTGQDSKLRGWRQLSENHFIRGDGRVHIITHPTSMTVVWDDLPREFW